MTDQAPTRKDQVKRRDSGCIPSGAPQQKRPMSAIIPTIMGDQQGSGIPRSGSATSGPQASKQHKLKQRFTVIRKLGKGTYGKVQLAVNKETGQEVAIKTIKKTKIENEQDLERVRREIQIMSSIEHPHIIHIYEVFENKDKIVLIMQYAPGGELYEYVSESKMLDEHEARRLFRQIATAIYYCHQNKICHRDLKLENILLDEKNNAKLADFGLSNVFDNSRQLKTFCGSPLYASPEIVQGSPYEGPEVDCWSLGVLLYTLVYGAMPFDGSNFKRLVKQISEASYYEPKQRSQASHLIGRLLCADPLKRASIKDICLDPWVNGYQPGSASSLASPAAGLRVSPTNNGQSTHHPPLLKVAQDMANLTPVRLDILLALMPGASVAQQTVHPAADFSPEQEKIVLDQATTVTRQQSAIEGLDIDQRNPIMDHFGSELMEVDDNRSTSPVASYVVRDIEPRESAQNPPEMVIDSEVSADKPDELPAVGEGDKDSANVGETEENIETNSTKDEPSKRDEPASEEIPQPEVKTQDDEQIQVASVPDEPCPLNQTDESNHQVSNEPSPTMPSKSAEQVDAGSLNAEAAKEQEPIRSDNEPSGSLDATIESKLGTSPAEDSKTEGTNDAQSEEVSETKPKRIKKRVVVVKKKKKVAKKDDKEQLEATEASEVCETTKPAGADRTDPKAVGSGPRKVRIPETFQADSSPSEQPSPPRTVATRRQSALIADVSQKLLQQQQQNATGQPTSSAIEQDQHQLASVRVSSTKSEFERRASLAAALMTPPASASPKGSDRSLAASPGQQQAQQQVGSDDPINAAAEPVVFGGEILESVPTKREQIPLIDSTTVAAEPVIKLEPSQVQQLGVVASPAEPLTPTNTNEVSNLCGHEEVPEKCADRLSVDVQANRDGSRSDSVETIKAEWQEIPTATKATESLSGKMDSSPSRPNVRSSLQLNLQSVCGSSSSSSTPSRVSTGGSMGPAPITRSYKKVTFTKDGTCVTETGRIYSTQSGDGTVRHVERKSKVTHYPSDTGAACGSAGVRAAEATTHEEIVYESTHGGDPFQTHPFLANRAILPQSHQLSRLVMPTDSFFDESTTREQQAQELQEPSAANRAPSSMASEQIYQKARADSGSSCSSGSTDVFDDIFDNWTGAISMFNQGRHLDELRGSLMNRAFVTGSPLPFGRLTKPRSRRNSGSVRESQHRPQSSGASIFPEVAHQRCESATTAGRSVFGPESHPRRHRHRHSSSRGPSSTGRSSADPSGYESDVPFERPASATLGSARGRFGSSNLFPRAEVPVAEFGIDTDSFFGNDWREESLLERMELEHEMLRRKFAQQRKQLWKSSTPSLCQPSGSGMGGFSRGLSAQPPSLSDHGQTVAPQGQQVRSFVCHTNSGSSLRQSTPLSSSPVRRNTANLADHLPPRQAHTNRSSSKTSMITSQLANIQLSRPDERPSLPVPSQQQFKSASFIELKRNSSASSSKQQPASVQSHHQTAASLTFPAQLTPTTYSSATGEPTISDGNLTEKIDTEALGESQRGAETNSRIQNWLLQSAGNLSISSGSKSSTSDATLPSSSGRSDITAGTYLASSAGQMLRHDDLLAASSSNQSLSHGQPVRLHQQRQHSSRTIIGHQLPPMAGRSPSDSLDIRQGARSPRPAQPISLIVRSSSRQSISELNEPGHVERHKVYEAVETFVSGDGSQTGQSITRAHQTATHSTSAQVSNRKVFAFPDEAVAQLQHQQQSSQIIKTQLVTTSSCEKVFPKQSMSAQLAETQHQTSEMFASNAQPMSISTRPLDDFSDFDSLLGSGVELESHSSSSLLDQLRSRGYRSIMNQRMVGPSAQYQQQPPTQTTTTAVEPDVVTSSSNSMMTMSSSGVGCGFTGSIEEPPAQLRRPTQPRQQHHHQQQQQQQQQQPNQRDCFLPIDTQNRELECASQHQPADRMNACTQHDSVCQDGQLPVSTKNAMDASNQGHNIRGDEVDSWNPDRVLASSTVERHTETIADQEAMTSATELEDEDVREAKSNIKEYLDRIKETEKFIKSIHEEEEKSQRHRQESFLFNNLILSTKLNGFKTNGQRESSLDMPAMDMCFNAPCGPYSAPVTMMARSSYNVDHDPASDLKLKSSSGMRDFCNNHHDTSLSCFSSDLFKPISCSPNSASNSSLINSASVGSYRDPLEPIQPISMHAYAPPARWQRSRSQLGNDHDYHGRIESPLVGTGRRPLSASIDSNTSGNPYFPTRHRRSTSQVRYPPAVNPLMSTMIAPCSDNSSSMVSEYRSSFGPNLGQPNRHQRHQSLAPRSPCRSSQIPRATSPSFSKTLTDDNVHDQDADDDDDLGMSAYRPSSYVPKVVPEGTHTSRHRDRIASRLSDSTNVGLRARSISRDLEKGERSPLIQSSVAGRRSSVQTMNGSAASNDEKETNRDSDTDSATRRRSWTTNDSSVSSACGSRLSELEQRIQANKRRREELLQGINSQSTDKLAASTNEQQPTSRLGRGPNNDDAADDSDQSCGFERPSRPINRTANQHETCPAPTEFPSDPQDSKKPTSSINKFRASRLESMEARIRRKSYCVKVRSPERTARK